MSAAGGPGLGIQIPAVRAEQVEADLLLVPCFEDERPPRGAAGRVDWRRCGQLSQEILAGFPAGRPGSALLLPTAGRLASPRALVFGLGPRAGFDAERLEAGLTEALGRAAGLQALRVALALPAASHAGLAPAAVLGAALAACPAAVRSGFPRQLWLGFEPEDLAAARRELERLAPAALPAGVALGAAPEAALPDGSRGPRAAAGAARRPAGRPGPRPPAIP